MSVTKDIALNIIGQIRDYQASVSQIPGMTEKAAAQAAVKMQAVFVKQAKDQVALTQQTANKVVQVQNNAANKVATGFGDAFNKAARSVMQNQLVSQVETVGSLFIQLGGNVSRVASIFTSVVRPAAIMNAVLGESAGGLALVAVEAVAAVAVLGAVVYGFASLGSSASAAREELEKFGIGVSKEAQDDLNAYKIGADALTIAIDKLKVAAGSDFAEKIGATKLGLAQFVDMVDNGSQSLQRFEEDVATATYGLSEYAEQLTGVSGSSDRFKAATSLLGLAINPLKGTVDALLGRFEEQGKTLAENQRQSEEYAREMKELDRATEMSNRALGENVKRLKERAAVGQDATTGIKNEIEATAEWAKAQAAWNAAKDRQKAAVVQYNTFRNRVVQETLTDEDKIREKARENMETLAEYQAHGVVTDEEIAKTRAKIEANLQEDLAHIRRLGNEAELAERTQVMIAENNARKSNNAAELQMAEDVANAWVSTYQSIADMVAQKNADIVADDKATLDNLKQHQQDLVDKVKETDDDLRQLHDDYADTWKDKEKELVRQAKLTAKEDKKAKLEAEQALVENKIQATELKIEEDKRLARQAAIASRAVAVFSIGLSTAEAIGKAIAQWGPPPSPMGVLAIASAGMIGAAQLTTVLSEPLPTFFSGSSRVAGAGEVAATLHGGESVLNSRATRDLGPAIIDALNSGLSPLQTMQSGGAGDVMLDGMQVGRVMARQARSAGAFGSAVRTSPVGFVNPYGRF